MARQRPPTPPAQPPRARLADFREFLRELGRGPADLLPWQETLARHVLTDGWSSNNGSLCLDLLPRSDQPFVVDLAAFGMACDPPVTPRRIFVTVDRRLAISACGDRARQIATQLANAQPGTMLARCADSLRALRGTTPPDTIDEPLLVCALRGGTRREDNWTLSPTQPAVIVTTVDQFGSRLLFRGYGMHPRMWPVAAGLAGTDSLVVLEEAHLSAPFAATLEAVRIQSRHGQNNGSGASLQVVSLGRHAPPGALTISLTDADRQHPVLRRQLNVSRPTIMRLVPKTDEIVPAFVAAAQEMAQTHKVVGVVVNRVLTARQVYEQLARTGDAILLTGRNRPADHDRMLHRSLPRIRSSRQRNPDDAPLYVVTTQVIEVDSDLDFDALVTECAPIDVLAARFACLNVPGTHEPRVPPTPQPATNGSHAAKKVGKKAGKKKAGKKAATATRLEAIRAVIIASSEMIANSNDATDPIYDLALRATWRWLKRRVRGKQPNQNMTISLAEAFAGTPPPADTEGLCAPRTSAPALMPAHIDLLAQTSPVPSSSPDIPLFLHGPGRRTDNTDVGIVWRADLHEDNRDDWCRIVEALPPSSGETLLVPHNTLSGTDPWLADAPGIPGRVMQWQPRYAGRVLRWCGEGDPDTGIIPWHQIQAGDLIVIPASRGGCDEFGPTARDTRTTDLGDVAALGCYGQPTLRICPAVLASWGVHGLPAVHTASDIPDWLEALASHASAPEWARNTARWFAANQHARPAPTRRRPWRAVKYPGGWLVQGQPLPTRTEVRDLLGFETMITTPHRLRRRMHYQVPLGEHLLRAGAWVEHLVGTLGLPGSERRVLTMSGRYHDLAKADPRWQEDRGWGGNQLAAANATFLVARTDQSRHRLSQTLPDEWRHEAVSVAVLEAEPNYQNLVRASGPVSGIHQDLLYHVIGAHHGHGRPGFPALTDGQPLLMPSRYDLVVNNHIVVWPRTPRRLDRIDSEWPARLRRLHDHYGWWRLAWYEAIVRIADQHAATEEECHADDNG